jgi:hypothetical protein
MIALPSCTNGPHDGPPAQRTTPPADCKRCVCIFLNGRRRRDLRCPLYMPVARLALGHMEASRTASLEPKNPSCEQLTHPSSAAYSSAVTFKMKFMKSLTMHLLVIHIIERTSDSCKLTSASTAAPSHTARLWHTDRHTRDEYQSTN